MIVFDSRYLLHRTKMKSVEEFFQALVCISQHAVCVFLVSTASMIGVFLCGDRQEDGTKILFVPCGSSWIVS